MARAKPPLIAWASRGAGAVGVITAMLYVGIIIGEDQNGLTVETIAWTAVMAAGGLLAWFADRVETLVGRRMMWGAFVIFFVVGILSIFSIGLLLLLASVLAAFSLSRSRLPKTAVGQPETDA